MPRLPNVTARKAIQALKRAGFVEIAQKGSHVSLWNAERDALTAVPLHSGDLKRPLLKGIIKQAGLTEEEFRQLL